MRLNILAILIKNTAALDYVLPVLCKIKKEHPQANVSMLYCRLSRKEILRNSSYYSRTMRAGGIRELDFANFLRLPFSLLGGLCRRWLTQSLWDNLSSRQKSDGLLTRIKARLIRLLRGKINYASILRRLKPDIILMDHTQSGARQFRGFLDEYLRQHPTPVVLLPHAPHHAYEIAFSPYGEGKDRLPDFCRFWMPFKFERSWEAVPEQASQFVYIGYPGMDSEWLEKFAQNRRAAGPGPASKPPLRCLFVIRRFLGRGQARGPKDNPCVYDYEEIDRYLNLLGEAIRRSGQDIEVIVKPHPSNDFIAVENLFSSSTIPHWRLSQEPVYALLNEIDFVVSLYSTVFFIPTLLGVPAIVLNSSTQAFINKWETMASLYGGFRYFLEQPEDLPDMLPEVLDIARSRRETGQPWLGDVEHLRQFYPDGAGRRAIDDIWSVLEQKGQAQ